MNKQDWERLFISTVLTLILFLAAFLVMSVADFSFMQRKHYKTIKVTLNEVEFSAGRDRDLQQDEQARAAGEDAAEQPDTAQDENNRQQAVKPSSEENTAQKPDARQNRQREQTVPDKAGEQIEPDNGSSSGENDETGQEDPPAPEAPDDLLDLSGLDEAFSQTPADNQTDSNQNGQQGPGEVRDGSVNDKGIEWEDPSDGRSLVSGDDPVIPANISIDAPVVRVVVSFTLLDDGHITDLNIKESSGYSRVDQRILTTLRNWFFQPAPGASPVQGEIAFVLRTTR